jgi:hypothetical protein
MQNGRYPTGSDIGLSTHPIVRIRQLRAHPTL